MHYVTAYFFQISAIKLLLLVNKIERWLLPAVRRYTIMHNIFICFISIKHYGVIDLWVPKVRFKITYNFASRISYHKEMLNNQTSKVNKQTRTKDDLKSKCNFHSIQNVLCSRLNKTYKQNVSKSKLVNQSTVICHFPRQTAKIVRT